MARQDIYLGVEGNDGTGDSIREAFKKANENFTELYAVFGQGGTISFTALSDTPTAITPNGLLIGNTTGTELIQKTLTGGTGISIDNTSATNITITNTGANINADTSPILGGPLSGNAVYPIGKINTSPAAVAEFNQTHASQITIDDLVTDKKYQVDIFLGVGGGPEGVLAAAALDTFNCSFQGRFLFETDVDKKRAKDMGINNLKKKYELKEIVKGDSIFCATGITSGDLVSGIKIEKNEFISETLVTHKSSGLKKIIKKVVNR